MMNNPFCINNGLIEGPVPYAACTSDMGQVKTYKVLVLCYGVRHNSEAYFVSEWTYRIH